MYCWICNDIVFNNYYLIPLNDSDVSNNKNYHIKVDCFDFFYNITCETCLNNYLKNFP